jgi:hypothetical protein
VFLRNHRAPCDARQAKQGRNTSQSRACTLGGCARNGNEERVMTLWHGSQQGKKWLMQPSAAKSINVASIAIILCCTISSRIKPAIRELTCTAGLVHQDLLLRGRGVSRWHVSWNINHQSQSSAAPSMSTSSRGCSWAHSQYFNITSSDENKSNPPFQDLDYSRARASKFMC